MALVGQFVDGFVLDQVRERQLFFGNIGNPNKRSQAFHQYSTSRTAWIKLASGVKLEAGAFPDYPSGGIGPAQRFTLFNGTSTKGTSSGMRKGIGKHGSYDTWDKDYGVVPMPGILSADIKALNKGSIKKADIKIKCWSKKQFEIIDKLYLRLGYIMLLEWGWSHQVTGENKWELVGDTIINHAWWEDKDDERDIYYWLAQIKKYRIAYNANYDGLIGKVTNFNWSIDSDGAYDITINLISPGDVIESLTFPITSDGTNATSQKISEYVKGYLFKDEALKSCYKPKFFTYSNTTTGGEAYFRYNNASYMETSKGSDQLASHLVNLMFIGRGFANGMIYYWGYNKESNSYRPYYQDGDYAGSDAGLKTQLQKQFSYMQNNYIDYISRMSKIKQDGIATFYKLQCLQYNSTDSDFLYQRFADKKSGFDRTTNKKGKIAAFSYFSVIKAQMDNTLNIDGSDDFPKKGPNTKGKIYGPQNGESYQDAFVMMTEMNSPVTGKKNGVVTSQTYKMHSHAYVRLQYILYYIDKYIIPANNKRAKKPPIVGVDWNVKSIPGYVSQNTSLPFSYVPSQVVIPRSNYSLYWGKGVNVTSAFSLDYLVSQKNRDGSVSIQGGEIEHTLRTIPNLDGGGGQLNYMEFKNTYLGMNFLVDLLDQTSTGDKNPKIDVFSFLKGVCNAINDAFGNVNNLYPVVDDETNKIKIIDGTSYPWRKSLYNTLDIKYEPPVSNQLLQMFGYRGIKEAGKDKIVTNFVRKYNLNTKISKELAAMISIGATAKGSAVGMNATAFSRFNKGLINRFENEVDQIADKDKSNKLDAYQRMWKSLQTDTSGKYSYNKFLDLMGFSHRKGIQLSYVYFLRLLGSKVEKKNASLMHDVFDHVEAKSYENKKSGSPTIGFIPFSLDIDLDGISGYKIYNKLNADTSFLPSNYPTALEFVLSGVDHSIKDNDWVTKLKTIPCPAPINSAIETTYQPPDPGSTAPTGTTITGSYGDTVTTPAPDSIGGDLLARRNAMEKSYKHVFNRDNEKKAACSRWTANLMVNYLRFLKGLNGYPSQIAADGNANQTGLPPKGGSPKYGVYGGKMFPKYWSDWGNMDGHLNWTEKFETMGYIRKDVVQNKSRDTVNQYIHKLMNPSDPNHFEYGDVCVYWALDPNPSLPLNYAGFTNNNNAAWNYGHAQIWVGDINKGIMTDFPPGGALGPKAVGWASSTKANYGSYDGFVYRHCDSTRWSLSIYKAPGDAGSVNPYGSYI
jgi:hypothetical protein